MSDTLTSLSALATPTGADLIYVVDDPAGTPTSKKIDLTTLFGNLDVNIETTGTVTVGDLVLGSGTLTGSAGTLEFTGISTFNDAIRAEGNIQANATVVIDTTTLMAQNFVGLELTPVAANPGGTAANTLWKDSNAGDRWTFDSAVSMADTLRVENTVVLNGGSDAARAPASSDVLGMIGGAVEGTDPSFIMRGSGASSPNQTLFNSNETRFRSTDKLTNFAKFTSAGFDILTGGALINGVEVVDASRLAKNFVGLELTPVAANPGGTAANTLWKDSGNGDRWTFDDDIYTSESVRINNVTMDGDFAGLLRIISDTSAMVVRYAGSSGGATLGHVGYTAANELSFQNSSGTPIAEMTSSALDLLSIGLDINSVNVIDGSRNLLNIGTIDATGKFTIENTQPKIHFIESDRGADQKTWQIQARNSDFQIGLLADDLVFGQAAISIERSTLSITSVKISNSPLNIVSDELQIGGVQVVTSRQTGWGAPTGTATRTTFDTTTVTTEQLAERVHALIDDLTTHGLIGA